RKKGFLNALSMGILVFLISDVLANAWAPTKLAVTSAYTGTGSPSDAVLDLVAFFGGLGLGLLGLASYEQRYIRRITLALKSVRPGFGGMTGELNGPATRARGIVQEQGSTCLFVSSYHLATMIAMSIGLLHLREGLVSG